MFLKSCHHFIFVVTLCCFVGFGAPSYAQIVTNTNANLAFGTIDFADTHNGRIRLGTNGNVSATGSGLFARDDGNAGRLRITSPDSGTLEVKCSETAQMVDPDAPNLTIENIEVAVNVGLSFGNATACEGVLPADPVVLTLDMDMLGDPDILIGGDVPINNLATFPSDREFSSTGGGSAIRLSITVQ